MIPKIISPAGWDFGTALTELVKVSSRGLIGYDRNSLIKRAGYNFAEQVDRSDIQPGDVPLHQIAMGADERYGSNRNGDTWSREELINRHFTFVKHARYFRSHLNKDPKKSYGVIKASTYHHPMDRVELLILLNGTKEAAERNGGLLADKELDILEKKGEIPGSMACVVPADYCSSCGNRAPTRDDYCLGEDEGGHCKHGGCRNRLTRVCEDGHVLHVQNRDSTFIDFSDVVRPADRTAFGGPADYLTKAASGSFVGGAEMAEQLGVTVPTDIAFSYAMQQNPEIEPQFKLACALAIIEGLPSTSAVYGYDPTIKFDASPLGKPGTTKFAEALTALAREGIILPLQTFCGLWSSDQQVAKSAQVAMNGIYSRSIQSENFSQKLSSHIFRPSRTTSQSAQTWAKKHAEDFSLLPEHIENRRWLSALRGTSASYLSKSKTAADLTISSSIVSEGMKLAESYAVYQVAALCEIAALTNDFGLTATTALRQNHNCDAGCSRSG